jgi:hypothetical protein
MAVNEAGLDNGAEGEASAIERRRGLRIQQTRPIKVFEPTGSRYFGGQTQDVSSTGLRLKLPCSMPVCLSETGQALANRRNMIPARVVWVNRPQQTDARTLSIGVEFLASISAQLDAA